MADLASRLTAGWYDSSRRPPMLLTGLSGVYGTVVRVRRFLYHRHLLRTRGPAVPVVVVGNITVGGTGKTPLVEWLVHGIESRGLRAGIVSRGYGGSHRGGPRRVAPGDDPAVVGDEPLLLCRRTQAPVVICPDRAAAAALVAPHVDVIVCDDGLQHLRLRRDLEIAVIDADRGLGNERLLPAGPLREPADRLRQVDFVVENGRTMILEPGPLQHISDQHIRPLAWLREQTIHAVAGIGNPERFFRTLERLGATVVRRVFPDHHEFQPGDLADLAGETVVMTEKDAVKCSRFAGADWWMLPVAARLEDALGDRILERVASLVEQTGDCRA